MKKQTGFSAKVYSLVKSIPKGKVTTYKEIANALGTSAYQAVGQILAKNPEGFLSGGKIPCHRVVSSDGKIGGFCGSKCGEPICQKKKLLEKEGIRFGKDNNIIDFEKKFFRP